jgi:8-oxo-dGTP pyrophosphatase MutT (NUDIX family)
MKLLEVLKAELIKTLPGRKVQLKMAPIGRKFIQNPSTKKNASVSIIIIDCPEIKKKEIIFIKRPEYDGPHSGQVSFPGGKQEASDQTLLNTAIRECYEEVGLKLKAEYLAGKLTPLFIPISEYMVYPYIFVYAENPSFKTDLEEVNYLIRYPVKELLCEELRQKTMLDILGQKFQVPYYSIQNELVWGATAMILSEFIEILKNIETKNPGII